jgi:hypothetical protein
MNNEELNPRVMAVDVTHPAKRFLLAFLECRQECAGRELAAQAAIDQAWQSATDGQEWTFSGFAYRFLSLDVALDDFDRCPALSCHPDGIWPWDIPRVRALMHECNLAARHSDNTEVFKLSNQVLKMFDLWEEYLVSHNRSLSKHRQ